MNNRMVHIWRKEKRKLYNWYDLYFSQHGIWQGQDANYGDQVYLSCIKLEHVIIRKELMPGSKTMFYKMVWCTL